VCAYCGVLVRAVLKRDEDGEVGTKYGNLQSAKILERPGVRHVHRDPQRPRAYWRDPRVRQVTLGASD